MRAAMLHGFADVRVEQVPSPRMTAGEALLDVACVQPSVTEAMLIAGAPVALHDTLAAALRRGPVAFGGHEFAAILRDLDPRAAGLTDLRPGARVTAVETESCGRCRACRTAQPQACPAPQILGFTRPGAFADRLVVPATSLVAVPPGVSAAETAAIQPLAGALHALAEARLVPGESILITGSGVMALLIAQVARLAGAGRVIVAGGSRDLGRSLLAPFAEAVLAPGDGVEDCVLDLTGGLGVDVAFDTAGGAASAGLSEGATMALAARSVRRGGRIVVVSVLPDSAQLPLALLRSKYVSLHHPRSGAGAYAVGLSVFDHALALVARGEVDLSPLTAARLEGIDSLPRAVAAALVKDPARVGPVQVHTEYSWNEVSG